MTASSPEASYQLMATPVTLADGATHPYGFGLELERFDGQPMIAHAGGINGFLSWLSYFPDQDVTVTVLVNAEAPAVEDLTVGVMRAVLP